MPSVEDWLIQKANDARSSAESEAWIATARTLSSTSFRLTYAGYEIHCSNRNTSAAAESLQQMYMSFNEEPLFWDEVYKLVEALKNEAKDELCAFYRGVFQSLVSVLQQSLLLEMAEKRSNPIEQCELYFLLLRMFEDSLAMFGLQLINVLTQLQHNVCSSELYQNPYIYLLVFEVLPVALKNDELPISEETSIQLFSSALEFWMSCLSHRCSQSKSEEISAAPSHFDFGTADGSKVINLKICKNMSTPTTEKELSKLWELMLQLFQALAARCGWKVATNLKNFKLETVRTITKHLITLEHLSSIDAESSNTALVIFLYCVYRYAMLTGSPVRQLASDQLVLVVLPPLAPKSPPSGLSPAKDDSGEQPLKRHRYSSSSVEADFEQIRFVWTGRSVPPFKVDVAGSSAITDSIDADFVEELFSTAAVCLSLLQRTPAVLEPFTKFDDVKRFRCDRLLFLAKLRQVIDYSNAIESACAGASFTQVCSQLQLCSANMALGNIGAAAKSAIQSVRCVHNYNDSKPDALTQSLCLARLSDGAYLTLMPTSNIVQYAVEVCLYGLTQQVNFRQVVNIADFRSLTFTVLLVQHNLKVRFKLFIDCMDLIGLRWVTDSSSSTYEELMQYSSSLILLEQMAYHIDCRIKELQLSKSTAAAEKALQSECLDIKRMIEAKASSILPTPVEVLERFLIERGIDVIDKIAWKM